MKTAIPSFTTLALITTGCTLSHGHQSEDKNVQETIYTKPETIYVNKENNTAISRNQIRRLRAVANPAPHLESQAGNSYAASNLVDGNRATAWALDLDKPGYTDGDCIDFLSFRLNCDRIHHIVITNGYAKNQESFINNSRATHVLISRVPWEEAEDCDIIYEGPLMDTPRPQTLPVSGTFDNTRPTRTIYLNIANSFHQGKKYNDLCISEIEFYGE